MRSVVLGAVSAMTLIAAASAADMYVPAPASTGSYKDEPIFATWTGFYLGVNGGYGWQNNIDIDVKTFPTSGGAGVYNSYEIKSNLSGGFGGGEIGYNFQRNNIVFGVEADIQGSDLKDSGTSRFLVGPNQVLVTLGSSIDVNWFGSVRGRLGYAFDRTLVYATGGFAFGGVDAGYSYLDNGGSGKGSKSDILTGYAAGGGIEHKLSPAWSLKAEYQYIDLGSISTTFPLSVGYNGSYSEKAEADIRFHTVRLGLNYKIGETYEPLK